jgi:sec-independent protein translocase protein TatA
VRLHPGIPFNTIFSLESFMFGIGVQELLIVLVIALVVFGGKNLPRIGSDMGRAIRNFKSAINTPDPVDIEPVKGPEDKGPKA